MKYDLVEVERFPTPIEPGILYWSKEFKMSAHRCACGCGDVIQLPVDDQNFRITVTSFGPTLRPSVGNWHVCDAHYYITNGAVQWLGKMSKEDIARGRAFEDARREAYAARKPPIYARFTLWLKALWNKLRGK